MKALKRLFAIALMLGVLFALSIPAFAATEAGAEAGAESAAVEAAAEAGVTGSKATASAILIGVAALSGALAMGLAISKSAESIARQPEAAGSIRTAMMLGLVFIETVVIYALIVAILIIFVL